ncbi:MAG: hypothetical protein ACI89X_001653 [Planctomycetota bacterium]|jgi:hypothetical protein
MPERHQGSSLATVRWLAILTAVTSRNDTMTRLAANHAANGIAVVPALVTPAECTLLVPM